MKFTIKHKKINHNFYILNKEYPYNKFLYRVHKHFCIFPLLIDTKKCNNGIRECEFIWLQTVIYIQKFDDFDGWITERVYIPKLKGDYDDNRKTEKRDALEHN